MLKLSENMVEKYKFSGEKKWQSRNNKQNNPSTDVSALIDTITAEGRAYRKEEDREERRKALREWITIILIALTLFAVGLQVNEMIKVYEPIRTQSAAAISQAWNARTQADAAKVQADAAASSVAILKKEFVANQRAWVGPVQASIDATPIKSKPFNITIQYQNSGREPASNFIPEFRRTIAPSIEETFSTTESIKRSCMNKSKIVEGQIVYPTIGGLSSYNWHGEVEQEFVTDKVISGDNIIAIQGCFIYKTMDKIHHSYFCYYYKGGSTKIESLNICPIGQYAD